MDRWCVPQINTICAHAHTHTHTHTTRTCTRTCTRTHTHTHTHTHAHTHTHTRTHAHSTHAHTHTRTHAHTHTRAHTHTHTHTHAHTHIHTYTQHGHTPAHRAVILGCPNSVSVLLTHGADFSITDSKGRSALKLAELLNNIQCHRNATRPTSRRDHSMSPTVANNSAQPGMYRQL